MGNISLLSDEQISNVDVTLYTPVLSHLKKIILSQENLKLKGIIARFPLQENACRTQIAGKLVGWYMEQVRKEMYSE